MVLRDPGYHRPYLFCGCALWSQCLWSHCGRRMRNGGSCPSVRMIWPRSHLATSVYSKLSRISISTVAPTNLKKPVKCGESICWTEVVSTVHGFQSSKCYIISGRFSSCVYCWELESNSLPLSNCFSLTMWLRSPNCSEPMFLQCE